ncbi:hypothetical protein SIN8267_00183 [Sinobacterium norvegicum]|uniref:Uncharacterized protein n=1 Tax=Sinobacterium norvegicum TaxID=1641715 RepID=A0ABM9AA52_9GAMM|nr:hypothetical protein SIN8267_00183 [Sinobacterium norvegicum]
MYIDETIVAGLLVIAATTVVIAGVLYMIVRDVKAGK